jgi:hypothetical protein
MHQFKKKEPPRGKLRGIKPGRFRIALKVIRVIRVICEICGLQCFRVFGWKNSFKTCASGSVAILSTVTEFTPADLARTYVAA